jgi:hypothetical protein
MSVTFRSTINVSGSTVLRSNLSISGTTVLHNPLTSLSSLNVSGSTVFESVVILKGAVSVNSSMILSGAQTLNSTLNISGATTIESTILSKQPMTLASNLTINGVQTNMSSLNVSGLATFEANINIDGNKDDTFGLNLTNPITTKQWNIHQRRQGGGIEGDLEYWNYDGSSWNRRVIYESNGNVGIGSINSVGLLNLNSNTQSLARLTLTGQEFYQASNTSTEGIALLTGVNRSNNRQLWIGQTDKLNQNTSNSVIRIIPNTGGCQIDAIATDGITVKSLVFNPNGGNIGIGTTSPTGNLDIALPYDTKGVNILELYPYVQFEKTHAVNLYWYSEYWRMASTRGINTDIVDLIFNRNGTDRVRFGTDGTLYNSTGTYTTSDSRIKKDIEEINDGEALEKLRKVEPKKYNYKDPERKSDKKVYGFIAQNVRDNIPEAVELRKELIPNIISNGTITKIFQVLNSTSSNEYLNFSYKLNIINEINEDFVIGTKIKIKRNNISYDVFVKEQIDRQNYYLDEENFDSEIKDNLLSLIQNDESLDIFVYGSEIYDFNYLKKDYLFTINFAATQELDRQLQSAKNTILSLENTIQNQNNHIQSLNILVNDLLYRVSKLESV